MADYGEQLLTADGSPVDKFRSLSQMLLRTISLNKVELTVFFRELNSLTGDRRRELLKVRDRFEDIWDEILQQGIDEGVFRAVDPIIVKGLLGMHNYAYVWVQPHGRLDPDEVSQIFSDVLLEGLLAERLAE